ncbi:ATP-dependent DNA ligase [Bradyrhizobium sp. LM6.10]
MACSLASRSSRFAAALRADLLANEVAKIFTRRGHDWTHRFKKVAHDAWRIRASSAVIDSEIVVPAADGTTNFSVLQNEL